MNITKLGKQRKVTERKVTEQSDWTFSSQTNKVPQHLLNSTLNGVIRITPVTTARKTQRLIVVQVSVFISLGS